MSEGRLRRVFGLVRKRPNPVADPRTEVIDVAPGEDFSDLTSVELCDRAVAEGRVEQFLLVGERFGGEPAGPNVILGPAGSAAAKARIDDEIAAVMATGVEVSLDAGFYYGDGDSRVPRTVTFELGSLGTRVLRLW